VLVAGSQLVRTVQNRVVQLSPHGLSDNECRPFPPLDLAAGDGPFGAAGLAPDRDPREGCLPTKH